MTEKRRYGMSNETGAFIDKKFNKEYTDDEIIDLLNDLSDENEHLKKQLKELQEFKDNYDKNMELLHNSEYVQDFLNGNL